MKIFVGMYSDPFSAQWLSSRATENDFSGLFLAKAGVSIHSVGGQDDQAGACQAGICEPRSRVQLSRRQGTWVSRMANDDRNIMAGSFGLDNVPCVVVHVVVVPCILFKSQDS